MSAPYHFRPYDFRCGACGTNVNGIYLASVLREVMVTHAELCPGYPPDRKPPTSGEAQQARIGGDPSGG